MKFLSLNPFLEDIVSLSFRSQLATTEDMSVLKSETACRSLSILNWSFFLPVEHCVSSVSSGESSMAKIFQLSSCSVCFHRSCSIYVCQKVIAPTTNQHQAKWRRNTSEVQKCLSFIAKKGETIWNPIPLYSKSNSLVFTRMPWIVVRVSTEGTGLSPSIRSMEQGQWTDRQTDKIGIGLILECGSNYSI